MAFSFPSITDSYSLLLLAAILAASLISSFPLRRRSHRLRRYHPTVGSDFHMILNSRRIYEYITGLFLRRKSFRILSATLASDVYTTDPAVIEHVLRTNFQNYGKGKYNYDILKDLLGDGIFAVDGAKWKHQRKLASFEFSTRSLKEISGQVFKKNAARLSCAIAQAADSSSVVDLQELFAKSTLDSIFEVSFGTELNSLQSKSDETKEFVRALDEANELTNWRYLDPLWKIKKFFGIGSTKALKKNIKIVDNYVYKLIQSKIDQNLTEPAQKHDILSRFLKEREMDPDNLSQRYLRDIVINLIVAGKDTTAGTLSWLFYLLCKHPRVEEKILEEIEKSVGPVIDESVNEFLKNLKEESLERMTYLHAAIVETLRLYPAVAVDGKICFSDDTLPDGYDVREGEFVLYAPYSMGRMKELWGEDAEDYRPERWLDDNGNFCPESPFKFTAFQAGPRICLGREFAYRQMKIFAAVLLRFFTFKLRDEEDIRYRLTFTLFMDPGLNVQALRRKNIFSS